VQDRNVERRLEARLSRAALEPLLRFPIMQSRSDADLIGLPCQPPQFESMGEGSNHCNLSDEQYAKLKRG